jgi:serine/tyrosine/threonine adenylyltransferase
MTQNIPKQNMQSDTCSTPTSLGWNFDNTYASLPEFLYTRLNPVPVAAPRMVVFNRNLADALNLNTNALDGEVGAAIFAGNRIPAGAEPIAQAYAGHQFGHFTMLGDGRAILLGEHLTPNGARFDIQLKGSGQTPFSRRGDGRAALGPMLREYIISEAMHYLGIPTTRSLAVVTTGESVLRETRLRGAILTRVASSHIRVGTFEYLASQNNWEGVRLLVDYTIRRHFPDLIGIENPYLRLLHAVLERQASLVAKWLHVGFIHGVMNTDNMSLCGESIDYGPCAFMDIYDPDTVFSSIDHGGRYAYGNQPLVAQWNLARFAETLLPLFAEEHEQAMALAKETVASFPEVFRRFWLSGMRTKLGLTTEEVNDTLLIEDLLSCMHEKRADYTNTLRDLALATPPDEPFFLDPAFLQWHGRWQARLSRQPEAPGEIRALMLAVNPAVIPRNHRVEEALQAADQDGDLSKLERLVEVISRPYDDLPEQSDYRTPPEPSNRAYKTFCGT